MKRIITIILSLAVLAALTACGGQSAAPAAQPPAAETPAEPERVTVRIGLTGTIYEDIWAPVAEELAGEGIDLEYVQFTNFSLPNEALQNGDIEMNAFQHHAFFANDCESNGYDLTDIGDTYIVAMNVYSKKIDDLSELRDGAVIGLPSDVTNEGRALKLLESAGLFELDPAAGASPTLGDITKYNVKLEFREVEANLVYSILPDVDAAVINGNYALDSGLTADDAIYCEKDYPNNSYYCLIAVRSEDADDPVYQRIVQAYQSDKTIQVYNEQFGGFFIPTWTLGD